MDRSSPNQLPQAHLVTETSSLPLAVAVAGYIERGNRPCPHDAILVIGTARRSDSGSVLVFILTVGLLLLLVALAQALLASDVKKNVSKTW